MGWGARESERGRREGGREGGREGEKEISSIRSFIRSFVRSFVPSFEGSILRKSSRQQNYPHLGSNVRRRAVESLEGGLFVVLVDLGCDVEVNEPDMACRGGEKVKSHGCACLCLPFPRCRVTKRSHFSCSLAIALRCDAVQCDAMQCEVSSSLLCSTPLSPAPLASPLLALPTLSGRKLTALVEDNIGRLEVPVYDAHLVQVVDRDEELRHEEDERVRLSRLDLLPVVLDEVGEITAPEEVQDKVARVLAVKDKVQVAHERVVELGEDATVFGSGRSGGSVEE